MSTRRLSAALDAEQTFADGGDPALLDVQQVAQLLHRSARHVFRLSQAGHMPPPFKLGSLLRWNRQALQDWIERRCPRENEKLVEPTCGRRSRETSPERHLSRTERQILSHRLLSDVDRWREIPEGGPEACVLAATLDFIQQHRRKEL